MYRPRTWSYWVSDTRHWSRRQTPKRYPEPEGMLYRRSLVTLKNVSPSQEVREPKVTCFIFNGPENIGSESSVSRSEKRYEIIIYVSLRVGLSFPLLHLGVDSYSPRNFLNPRYKIFVTLRRVWVKRIDISPLLVRIEDSNNIPNVLYSIKFTSHVTDRGELFRVENNNLHCNRWLQTVILIFHKRRKKRTIRIHGSKYEPPHSLRILGKRQ